MKDSVGLEFTSEERVALKGESVDDNFCLKSHVNGHFCSEAALKLHSGAILRAQELQCLELCLS